MTSIEDKLNNFLVLERFDKLQQEHLEPKLGVYGENRLVIASQKRKHFFAKVYQLFIDKCYNPLRVFCGKLKFDENRISQLKTEVDSLKGDLSEKQRALDDLTSKVQAQREEIGACERRAAQARLEQEQVEKELLEKQHALLVFLEAESQIGHLTVQITHLEGRLSKLSNLEKEYEPAEQKMTQLRETIQQLESTIATLRHNAQQLRYKEKCKTQESTITSLRSQLASAQQATHKARQARAGRCLQCHRTVVV